MLLKESFNLLHMHSVIRVGVPLESRRVKVGVSVARSVDILLVLHIVVCHSWKLSTFPGEVTDVEGVVEWPEEEHAVCNK